MCSSDLEHQQRHRHLQGCAAGDRLTNAELLALEVDVLIPAALENQITADNASRVRARLVVEGANGPTTPDAHAMLHDRGVFVVPDILANSGGVTASYFEWVQDRHGYFWTERGYEFALLWAVLALAIFFRGGGRWSIDHYLGKEL